MRMYDILEKKKNNQTLTKEEIEFVVQNYTNGNIPDYQMSALLMAIVIQKMNQEEIKNLTLAMANSGDKIDLSKIKGNIVDKHSTGGVGDKTTLILAPIVACLDCKVAKMSGRGLGYTGGTIDKLESIGVKLNLEESDFVRQVNEIGLSIISQTANIALADKKIYALRDVTATVESIPLIASSIMSKKIASGSKNLVLDVKCGSGAFMKKEEDAILLGQTLTELGKMCNINTLSLVTNMDMPLGNKIGNTLEIEEVIDVLQNKGPKDITELSVELASHMVSLATSIPYEKAYQDVNEVLKNSKAYNKFKEWILKQGGHLDIPKATYSYSIYSPCDGYIGHMNTEEIGKLSGSLGSGRKTKEDTIDYTAGICLYKKTGDFVKKGQLLATLHSSTIASLKDYEIAYLNTIQITKEEVLVKPMIVDVIS